MNLLVRVFTILTFACCMITQTQAEDAGEIFEKASPGVVLINDTDSHGSGVVIQSQGTIITSYHLVNSALPISVTAQVSKGGKLETMTFKNVKVESIHKNYDLALIKVDLPTATRLIETPRDTKTPSMGTDCYIIGNTGGDKDTPPTKSISTGIIRGVKRVAGGNSFIQATATVTPSKSGGALINNEGKIAGITSFTIPETEDIGYAIPLAQLDMSDFGKPAEKDHDMNNARNIESYSNKWHKSASSLKGKDRESALRLAILGYRIAGSKTPTDPKQYYNIGNVYLELEQFENAGAYFNRAVEFSDRKNSHYLNMAAICLAQAGDVNTADKMWKEALLLEGDNASRSISAENLASSAMNLEKYSYAAYLVRWADYLGAPNPSQSKKRSQILELATPQMTELQQAFLIEKIDNFSFEDMEKFTQGEVGIATPEEKKSDYKSAHKALTTSKIFVDALKDAPDLGEQGVTKALPATIGNCVPAYGGVYAAMTFPDIKKVGLFNIAQIKFDKYLNLPSIDTQLAAGGNRLVMYDPDQDIFHIYDLNNFNKIASKISPVSKIRMIEMGSLNPDYILISWLSDENGETQFGRLKIPEMTLQSLHADWSHNQWRLSRTQRSTVHARVSSDMEQAVFWCSGLSPTGFTSATLGSNRFFNQVYENSSYGVLTMPLDTSIVVGGNRKLMDRKGIVRHTFDNPETGFKPELCVAIPDANYVVCVSEKKMWVIDAITLSELHQAELPFHFNRFGFTTASFGIDRCIIGSASLNKVAIIDINAKKLAVMPLRGDDFDPSNIREGLDLEPGTKWAKKLDYPKGSKIIIEDAPEGITYDPETMSISWDIPANQHPGEILILISITAPGQDEAYERMSLNVR